MKIFAGYLSAHSLKGFACSPMAIIAETREEAIGKAIDHSKKVKMPLSQGFYSHSADLVEIPAEMIAAVTNPPSPSPSPSTE